MPHPVENPVSRDQLPPLVDDFDSDFDAWFDAASPAVELAEPDTPAPNPGVPEPVPSSPEVVERAAPLDLPPRADWTFHFEDLGPIGQGATAVVHRVRDRALGRRAVVKMIREDLARDAATVERFGLQARLAARLEHPGVPAISRYGTTRDGRVWLLMELVDGEDLWSVAERVAAEPARLPEAIEALAAVGDVVQHAHEAGVVHGDLTPDDLRIRPHGRVAVLDWGMAHCEGCVPAPGRGNAAWMSPEQLAGDVPDTHSDVYALGALLFLVTTGRPPFAGETPAALAATRRAEPGPPPVPSTVPRALATLCVHAMQPVPGDRIALDHLVTALRDWLTGHQQEEQARSQVDRARRLLAEEQEARAQATVLQRRAEAVLDRLRTGAPSARRSAAWAHEDEAAACRSKARSLADDAFLALEKALVLRPDPDVRVELVDALMGAHVLADAADQADRAARLLDRTRRHVRRLPDEHPTRTLAAAYLQGAGSLTLVTEPTGVDVHLHRFEVSDRRLVPEPLRSLGRTPLHAVELPMGSYALVLSVPGCPPVTYPVEIGRSAHWDGVAPGESEPFAIELPDASAVDFGDVVVPAGWFASGAAESGALAPVRLWCDGFVMRGDPVSWADIRAWYAATGRRGPLGEDDRPAVGLDHAEATAFAAWEAERTGEGWRLPVELEWEKAARGVDGRRHPWGDRDEPAYAGGPDACSRPGPRPVAAEHDVSPYGIRGLGTNVACWCADAWSPRGRPVVGRWVGRAPNTPADAYVVRGGSWRAVGGLPAWRRRCEAADARCDDIGIRLVRSLR